MTQPILQPYLPKQWSQWVKKAGLRRESGACQRGLSSYFYLKGKNRNWRVNCFGELECSCPLEHFDRWANSRGANYGYHLPKTEAEFVAAVKQLVTQSADCR